MVSVEGDEVEVRGRCCVGEPRAPGDDDEGEVDPEAEADLR